MVAANLRLGGEVAKKIHQADMELLEPASKEARSSGGAA